MNQSIAKCRFQILAMAMMWLYGSLLSAAPESPQEWGRQKLAEIVKDEHIVYPRTILFLAKAPVQSSQDVPTADLDALAFNEVSFINAVFPRDLQWDFKLNYAQLKSMDPLKAYLQLTGADSVLILEKGDSGQFLMPSAKIDRTFASDQDGDDVKSLVANLIKALGWQGMVLDRDGNDVLVVSFPSILQQDNIQALSLQNSLDKAIIPENEVEAYGLLSLVKAEGAFAIFRVVYLKGEDKRLPPGTKLAIEHKNPE